MNWKIIIKPINVGWLSVKPKATKSSLRPIRTANKEKHRKEFICKKKSQFSSTSECMCYHLIRLCLIPKYKKDNHMWRKKEIHLTNDNILDGMSKLPVAKLMTQNSKDLWVIASLFLVLWKKIQRFVT